jgi:hypothetical protein
MIDTVAAAAAVVVVIHSLVDESLFVHFHHSFLHVSNVYVPDDDDDDDGMIVMIEKWVY